MARPRVTKSLATWMNGELVGAWTVGRSGVHTFTYASAWLDSPAARPISLSMPLRPAIAPYTGAMVEAFFDNLLPDSQEIRRRIEARFGSASDRAFDLLAEIGRDCVGAVQLLPDGEAPRGFDQIEGEPMGEAQVASLLRRTPASAGLGQSGADDFRISLAGAQEKTALLWHDGQWLGPRGATPTTHIFKLPMGLVGNMRADFSSSIENEWLCAKIVAGFGLPVANCVIATFEEQKALVVERFDRRLAAAGTHWLRLPQEDLCQATGTPSAFKYEADGGPGVQRAMDLLLGSTNSEQDREHFFTAQMMFWLLCATDGHAKNFSLHIEAGGRYRLAPLYDVLSAYPVLGHGANQIAPERARMAMAVVSANRHYEWSRIIPRHWGAMARRCGLPEQRARDLRMALAERAPVVAEGVRAGLPDGFPAHVANSILDGLTKAAQRLVT